MTTPAEVLAERGRLELQARTACEARGHLLHAFRPDEWRRTSVSFGCCARCGRGAQVNARPAAGEVPIAGAALMVDCGGRS